MIRRAADPDKMFVLDVIGRKQFARFGKYPLSQYKDIPDKIHLIDR